MNSYYLLIAEKNEATLTTVVFPWIRNLDPRETQNRLCFEIDEVQ